MQIIEHIDIRDMEFMVKNNNNKNIHLNYRPSYFTHLSQIFWGGYF